MQTESKVNVLWKFCRIDNTQEGRLFRTKTFNVMKPHKKFSIQDAATKCGF